jgi:hypothetical protein
MEDGQIGKHCDICLAKDYLNFFCSLCGKNLCKAHYHNEVNCSNYKETTIDVGKRLKTNVKCSHCNCEIFNKCEVICNLCNLSFCFKHRLYEDHKCKNYEKKGMKSKYNENKEKFKEKLESLKNTKK